MDVLLLSPPRDLSNNLAHSGRVIQSAGSYPPLGLAYLAGTLRDRGYSVAIKDLAALPLGPPSLERYLQSASPRVVGIGAMTLDLNVLDTLCDQVRGALKTACVVLGGPCMEDHPKEVLRRFPQVDVAVQGEGEFAFLEIVESVFNDRGPSNIPGTYFRQNGQVVEAPSRPVVEDLDEISIPAFEMIDFNLYRPVLTRGDRFATVYSSRGCPFNCRYCHRQKWLTKVRNHSAERVVEELEYLTRELGVTEVKFYDETFTLDRKRVLDICRLIVGKGLRISWEIRTRPDLLDRELAQALRQAGCYRICMGVEGGSQQRLKRMGRNYSIKQVEKAFACAHEQKISTLAFFMIGYPGDSLQDYEDVISFARRLRPAWLILATTTAYANTPIYDELLRTGGLDRDAWREFSLGQGPYPHYDEVTFDGVDYPKSHLFNMQHMALWRFYGHPTQLLKTLSDLRNGRVFKILRMGLALVQAQLFQLFKKAGQAN